YHSSHVTNLYRLFQRSQPGLIGISFWYEFLGHVSLEAGFNDSFHNGWIIQFLRVINFISARHTPGMVVCNVLVIVANGTNHISFINLHVIDVVEQAEVVRTYS